MARIKHDYELKNGCIYYVAFAGTLEQIKHTIDGLGNGTIEVYNQEAGKYERRYSGLFIYDGNNGVFTTEKEALRMCICYLQAKIEETKKRMLWRSPARYIDIFIPIFPRSYQGNGYYADESGKPRAYTEITKKEYMDSVALLALKAARENAKKKGEGHGRLKGPLRISKLIFHFESAYLHLQGTPARFCNVPDLDNLMKTLFDCIEVHLIENDRDIVEISGVKKVWSDKAGIDIRVEEID